MVENFNINRFYEKIRDLKAKFEAIEGFNDEGPIIDISRYKNEMERIKQNAANDLEETTKTNPIFTENQDFSSENIQRTSINLAFFNYQKELNTLDEEFKKEVEPYYQIKLRIESIKDHLDNHNPENINISEIIKTTEELIDLLINNNFIQEDILENDEKKQQIISEAYSVISKTILQEAIFDRTDISEYISEKTDGMFKEEVNWLIKRYAKDILSSDLDFATYYRKYSKEKFSKQGFGSNFLDQDFIAELAKNLFEIQNKDYKLTRDNDLKKLEEAKIIIEKQQQREQSLEANWKNQLRQVKKEQLVLDMKNFVLKGKKYLILTPLVLTIAGGTLGYAKSSQTTLYRTITESYNVDTEEPVDEPYYVYDEHKTSYVATVTVYGPWRKNPNGTGYLRTAEAYTYTPKEDSNEKITREDLFDDETRLKYKYTQQKSQLEDSDSMENCEIIITQTYQDADDTKKSTKYTLPAAALGLLIGLFVAFMTKSTKGYYIEKEFYRAKKRSEELEEIIREINKKLESPGNLDGAVEDLKSAYNNFIEIYGSNFEHKRLEKIASFLKTQEEAKKKSKTFSKILKK